MSIRTTLVASVAFSILAVGSLPSMAQSTEATRFKGVTLRVATWGGTTRDSLRDFVAVELVRRGATVEFVIGSPQDNFAKLIAARGQVPFDLVELLGTMRPEYAGRDLLAKLDLSNIPNGKSLVSSGASDRVMPTWITEEMIIYNTDKFREYGIDAPKSLLDLRNPKLAGRIAIPDISSGGGIESLAAFAITAGGSESNVAPGLKLIKELPDVRFWKAGGEVITQFKSGDIWVAIGHVGWALRTAQAGVPVATVAPKLGTRQGIVKEGYIGVVKGSPNQEAAEFFINTYLTAEAQYQFAAKVGVIPIVQAARNRMSDLPLYKELAILDQAKIDSMVRLDPAKVDLSVWNELWNRSVAR